MRRTKCEPGVSGLAWSLQKIRCIWEPLRQLFQMRYETCTEIVEGHVLSVLPELCCHTSARRYAVALVIAQTQSLNFKHP